MEAVFEVVRDLGGATKIANHLSEYYGETIIRQTVHAWVTRNSIPPEYWQGIVAMAQKHSVPSVSYDSLATVHAKPKMSRRTALAR